MTDVDPGGGASPTTEPASGSSTGTDVSLKEHLLALRAADLRFEAERDRRLVEIQRERDKAEVLRAANQAYRDEKANELREQINSERGMYVTGVQLDEIVKTINATLKPVTDYVSSQQGSRQGQLDTRQIIAWVVALILGGWAIFQAING